MGMGVINADRHGTAGPVVADWLRQARRRRFVGRTEDLELFRTALVAPAPGFTVLFLHGPGGVGKTTLLGALAEMSEHAGSPPARLDGRAIEPTPAAFAAALEDALGDVASGTEQRGDDNGPTARRTVILLDGYELLASIDGWLRDRFLPQLPGDALVAIAGRDAPSEGWRADPGWRDRLRIRALRNLSPDDTRAYLRAEGVPEALDAQFVAATHGHPLALSLLVDVLRQRREPGDAPTIQLGDAPDVVRMLLERFVDETPSNRHRRALQVAAHAPCTTEQVLREILCDDDAAQLLAWLRGLSFTEESTAGVRLHDLARDVLDADLRWRDHAAHSELHRQVQEHLLRRIHSTSGAAQERAITEMVLFQRKNPRFAHHWDWQTVGRHYPDALRPHDRARLVAMAERHQGRESAGLVEYWMDRQPHAVVVVRDRRGEPMGFGVRLHLHQVTGDDLTADPGARAMWEYAERHGPWRPGQEVRALRFLIDEAAYQESSPSFNVITIHHALQILRSPGLTWDFFGAYEDADRMAPIFTYLGYQRAGPADYEVGGRSYRVFARDWRSLKVEAWLRLLCQHGGDGPQDAPAPAIELTRAEFAEAVRDALRHLHRPDELAGSPLLRSRIVMERSDGTSPVDVLASLIREAADVVGADPRDAKLLRAIDRTYLRPASTQQRAAQVLGLPFSTYRRHLTTGVRRIAELLWQQELRAASEQKVSSDSHRG